MESSRPSYEKQFEKIFAKSARFRRIEKAQNLKLLNFQFPPKSSNLIPDKYVYKVSQTSLPLFLIFDLPKVSE